MPKIVYRGAAYERVTSHSWIERSFEDLVYDKRAIIFPRWEVVRFTADVTSPGGATKRPDLALIDRHYRRWWVVEVELQHHSLNGHVLPQIEVFAEGRYTAFHAQWIAERNPSLDPVRLASMMLGEPPGVLVVVDAPGTGWEGPLSDLGAKLGIVEPFQDPNGEFMLRLNGEQPEPPGSVLTRFVRRVGQARMWTVMSPAALPAVDSDDWITVEFQGSLSRWRAIRMADGVLMAAERGDPLPGLSEVDLILRDDASLEFVLTGRAQRGRT